MDNAKLTRLFNEVLVHGTRVQAEDYNRGSMWAYRLGPVFVEGHQYGLSIYWQHKGARLEWATL